MTIFLVHSFCFTGDGNVVDRNVCLSYFVIFVKLALHFYFFFTLQLELLDSIIQIFF